MRLRTGQLIYDKKSKRRGELLKLRWRDVDFASGIITLQAFNTKTMRKREVGITERLGIELEKLSNQAKADDLVFGFSEINESFRAACKDAGLVDLRFHDLRHVHATKLDELGFSIAEIANQLGPHSNSNNDASCESTEGQNQESCLL